VEAHGMGAERTPINAAEQAIEMTMMGLRLSGGLDLHRLAQTTGHAIAPACIERLRDDGLAVLTQNGRFLAATPRGALVLNSVIGAAAESLAQCGESALTPA
jgi:oxygen-independent coproporphyrinogen-3 oxidase